MQNCYYETVIENSSNNLIKTTPISIPLPSSSTLLSTALPLSNNHCCCQGIKKVASEEFFSYDVLQNKIIDNKKSKNNEENEKEGIQNSYVSSFHNDNQQKHRIELMKSIELIEKMKITQTRTDRMETTDDSTTKEKEEELCKEDVSRFCLFPIQYKEIWDFYKKHKSSFWTAEEIDFSADLNDWDKLNSNEKYFIESILAFFAGSDGIVLENLLKNFSHEITIPEARCFYGFQAMMENIHCCSGETEILTKEGWMTLLELKNKEALVWNGREFNHTVVRETKPDILYRVQLSNQLFLDCTSKHVWYIQDENGNEKKTTTIELQKGNVIMTYMLPFLPSHYSKKKSSLFPSILNSIFESNQIFENISVESVQKVSDFSRTFCFHENLRNRGVFNGILTGQSEVYSLMIDTLVKQPERKQELFDGIQKIPCVQKKAEWAMKWIENKNSLGKRLFAFAIVEGLFFSGSFCAIFWLKERGLMLKSLGKSNEWIARDEGLHTAFAILLYKYVKNKISQEEAHLIMTEAVLIEEEFICHSLPVSLIGMSSTLMKQYIRFVADRLLIHFQFEKIYNVGNPFPFMNKIELEGKTNFFEQKVSEYSLIDSISNDWEFHGGETDF